MKLWLLGSTALTDRGADRAYRTHSEVLAQSVAGWLDYVRFRKESTRDGVFYMPG